MSQKFKILSGFIKDMSSETPDVKSYLFTKDNISNYELDININSLLSAFKTILKFEFLNCSSVLIVSSNRPQSSV